MIDRALGILGLALTLFAWFAPSVWPQIPNWAGNIGIYLGIFLLGLAIGLLINSKTKTINLVDNATLSLHIYGDKRTPESISVTNVWRWYYLQLEFTLIHPETGMTTNRRISILFLNFDNPVKIGSLLVNSPNINLPTHEVKEFNNRFAIITFNDELQPGTLNITAKI